MNLIFVNFWLPNFQNQISVWYSHSCQQLIWIQSSDKQHDKSLPCDLSISTSQFLQMTRKCSIGTQWTKRLQYLEGALAVEKVSSWLLQQSSCLAGNALKLSPLAIFREILLNFGLLQLSFYPWTYQALWNLQLIAFFVSFPAKKV